MILPPRLYFAAFVTIVTVGCSSAMSPADEEYNRALLELHDQHVETGDPGELADATSYCFLTQDETVRKAFARAIVANRPKGIKITHGFVMSDCESDVYVMYDPSRRDGTVFKMNGAKMRILAAKSGVSAEEFAATFLGALVQVFGIEGDIP